MKPTRAFADGAALAMANAALATALVFSGATGTALAAAGDDDASEPTAVPYRPSVSAPAALSAPGWLEIEAGVQHDHAPGGARRDSVPWTAKLAFTPDWGVRIGGEAWARQRVPGRRDSGFGDLGFVVKRRFAVDDAQAFGLEAGAVYPTGARAVHSGSGKPDYAVAALYSADFAGDWHTDLNLAATRLGQRGEGSSRIEALYAAAVSHQFTDALGVVAEISGTRQRGEASTRQLLLAASYALGKRLVLDAGAARSLRGANEWSAFAGFTWTAARLFGPAP